MDATTDEFEARIARLEEALATAEARNSSVVESTRPAPVARPTSLLRVIRSELIKLGTLRSTWVMLGTIVAIVVTFGGIAAAVAAGVWSGPDGGGGGDAGSGDPLSTVLTGSMFGVLLVGVTGCLAGAREYGSRMITATIAAAPRRWQVVAGKAIALAAFIIPTALVASFGAYGLGMGILSANDAQTVSLGDGEVLGSVIGMSGYMTAIALLGLGLGVLLRSVASSIAVFVAGIMIVPGLAGALLPESWDDVLKFLPEQAAASFTAVGQGGATLGVGAGVVVVVAWVVAVIAAAVVSITRRDV